MRQIRVAEHELSRIRNNSATFEWQAANPTAQPVSLSMTEARRETTMSSSEPLNSDAVNEDPSKREGWNAALRELQHQAAHLEARGAHRAAVTLYDAIRIARAGGLDCGEHRPAKYGS